MPCLSPGRVLTRQPVGLGGGISAQRSGNLSSAGQTVGRCHAPIRGIVPIASSEAPVHLGATQPGSAEAARGGLPVIQQLRHRFRSIRSIIASPAWTSRHKLCSCTRKVSSTLFPCTLSRDRSQPHCSCWSLKVLRYPHQPRRNLPLVSLNRMRFDVYCYLSMDVLAGPVSRQVPCSSQPAVPTRGTCTNLQVVFTLCTIGACA
jgi:hypothetical protein